MVSKEKYWYFHLDIFPGGVPFVYLSSVMVDFKLKMMSLDDTSGRPKSQTDDQFTTSSPHCNCPEDTAKARRLVRRKSEDLKSSVMVDFRLKMMTLADDLTCPNSQNENHIAKSSPQSIYPEARVKFDMVRRKSEILKEIIIAPLEINVNAVIPLPRIIDVQEEKKSRQLTRKKEFRRNIDDDIVVTSSLNKNGDVSERNNQTIPSNSGKKTKK